MKLPSAMAANPAKPVVRYLLSKAEPMIISGIGTPSNSEPTKGLISDITSSKTYSDYSAVSIAMQIPPEPYSGSLT